jgi:hypothetical protein
MAILAILDVAGDVAFTVLGAVAVSALTALITARTTNQRLDRQLAAEKERLQLQLLAEEARQSEQLRHERELSDLSELRSLLDAASNAMSQAVKTANALAAEWLRRGESKEAVTRIAEQRQVLRQQRTEIAEFHVRIMLRLPPGSPVIDALKRLGAAISRLEDLSGRASKSDEEARWMNERQGAFAVADAHVAFLGAARDLVGSALPERVMAPAQ